MTNVNKKTKIDDVRLHIKQSFEFIDQHLPDRYVALVQLKMESLGSHKAPSGTIRNVRTKKGVKPYQNLPVITALLEVAKDIAKETEDFIDASSNLEPDEQ